MYDKLKLQLVVYIQGSPSQQEEFEDIKGEIRIRKSKKGRPKTMTKEKGQKDKQRSTKHNTEN